MTPRMPGKASFASFVAYGGGYAERCLSALEEALGATPAYRAWRRADPGPAMAPFARLAALPALTKADLRAQGPQGFVPHGRDLAAALRTGEVSLVATSGTTGDRVTNIWYQPWWDASEAASWELNAYARAAAGNSHREAILTSPWCAGIPCEDGYLTMEQRTMGRFLYLSERSDPSSWSEALMDRIVEEINAFRPAVLEANPSFLARLSRHIAANRRRVRSPGLIVLTYENPSLLHYRQIGRVFDAPIASSYGSTEAGYVFMECEAGRMHQVTASCHVDYLPFKPEHGGPNVGRILVTTFGNPWRALVRFDTGDVVRLDVNGPCPCGRSEGLTLAAVEGRTVCLTKTPQGRVVTQGEVDRALAEAPGLVEYQVVQSGPAGYALRCVTEPPGCRQAAGAACEALRALYGAGASVGFELVAGIAPAPPGKYRLARALRPVDADALLDDAYAPAALA